MFKKIKFPEPLVLLLGCIATAALATYALPSGMFDRALDPSSGREIVVAGSYHTVADKSIGIFDMLVAIPKGMLQAGDVIFFVFLVGGAFFVINKTGAFNALVEYVVTKLEGRQMLVVPICILLFATLGVIQNFQEEIIPLVPVLLLLCKRLGFTNLTAVALSIGAAIVGAAFSPINPFQVGIAQKVTGVDLLSGAYFRTIFLLIAIVIYTFLIYRYVKKTKIEPSSVEKMDVAHFSKAHKIIIAMLLITFVLLVVGTSSWEWGFEEMAALFFLSGIMAGIVGGLGSSGTVNSFIEGFKDMAYAGLLIGFARAIFVVLEEGQIVDTIVNGMFTPISKLPTEISLLGITTMQSVIHFPVPSVSGQAVLTMPLLAPLADLMGISRQLMILCYQYGAGIAELIVPTNGAVMAILAACKVPFDQWFKFAIKIYAILIVLGLVAIYIGLSVDI